MGFTSYLWCTDASSVCSGYWARWQILNRNSCSPIAVFQFARLFLLHHVVMALNLIQAKLIDFDALSSPL